MYHRQPQLAQHEVARAIRDWYAAKGLPPRARDLSYMVWLDALSHFGSMEAARLAAGVPEPPRATRWSEPAITDELRRLVRRGVRPTHTGLIDADRVDLVSAVREYFGSIVRARRAAGVPEPRRMRVDAEMWDAERVLLEIERRRRRGETLAYSKVPRKLQGAARTYFGSWRAAIEEAGLDYDTIRLVRHAYDADEILDLLRALAASEPQMTIGELHHHRYAPPLARLFGSVEHALTRAGLEEWPLRVHDAALTRTEVISRLRERRRAGQSIRSKQVERDDHHLYYSAMVRFGRYAAALAAARVRTELQRSEWTPAKVLRELRARRDRGQSLLPRDVKREQSNLYAAAGSYFGTYFRAASRLGKPSWQRQRWTRSRVIKELRRVAATDGFVTRLAAGNTLVTACDRHFGTFSAACAAAGLKPRRSPVGPNPRKREKKARTPKS